MGFVSRIIYRKAYKEITEQLDLNEEKCKSVWAEYLNTREVKPFIDSVEQLTNAYVELELLHDKYKVEFSKLSELEKRYETQCEDISVKCSKIKDDMYEDEYKFSPEFLVEFWGNGNSIPLYEDGYDEDYSKENHYNAKASPKGYGKEMSFKFAPYKSRINLNDNTETHTN